jgi:hypothetical protein
MMAIANTYVDWSFIPMPGKSWAAPPLIPQEDPALCKLQ